MITILVYGLLVVLVLTNVMGVVYGARLLRTVKAVQASALEAEREIAKEVLWDADLHKTINNWLGNLRTNPEFTQPPASRQHFDVASLPLEVWLP